MPVSVRSSYIAASANRASHVADWALDLHTATEKDSTAPLENSSVVAFATHKSIAIWLDPGNPEAQGISTLLPTGFGKPITALKFAHAPSSEAQNGWRTSALLAGSGDGSVGIWRAEMTGQDQAWTCTAKLNPPHSGSVSALGVLRPSTACPSLKTADADIFVTGGSDGLLRVWSARKSAAANGPDGAAGARDETTLLQEIDLRGALPLDIALTYLPASQGSANEAEGNTMLMALALTDRRVQIWASRGDVNFERKLVLEGHDDWVRALDFCVSLPTPKGDHSASVDGNTDAVVDAPTIMLATGSQDNAIRLWRIRAAAESEATSGDASASVPGTAAAGADEFEQMVTKLEREMAENEGSIATKAHVFDIERERWAVTFDALLIGHDGWITGLRWHPPVSASGSGTGGLHSQLIQPAALLSSSADNSLILWSPSASVGSSYASLGSGAASSSIWLAAQHFGEVAGPSNLGFFDALWGPAGARVLAHSWGGAFHLWLRDKDIWAQAIAVTGHFGSVKSIAWEPKGEFFLSASLDRTTRLHGQYRRAHCSPTSTTSSNVERTLATWHELARPQSHGYDLSAVAWLDRLSFASAADEKVVRIFAAPQGFVDSAHQLGTVQDERPKHTVLAFNLPTLGHVRSPTHLRSPIEYATRNSKSRLLILACTPLLDDVALGAAPKLSFQDAEKLLKWCYAQAWAVAVAEERFLLQIDVLLVPLEHAPDTCRRWAREEAGLETFYVVKEPSATLSFLHAQKPRPDALTPVALRPSGPADPAPEGGDSSAFPQHRVIALGGTFDHLHVGHKILLSMAALLATERIIVGVTDDSMLTKKSNAHLLEPLSKRLEAVGEFISLFRSPLPPLQQHIVPLSDVCGPAGTEQDLQGLLVTDETVAGAQVIAKTRAERNLPEVDCYTIGVIGAGGETDVKGSSAAEFAASKVGSTAIREWLSKQAPSSPQAGKAAFGEEARPIGASVPPLGLSNRAIFEGRSIDEGPSESGQPLGSARESRSTALRRPPVEEQLQVSTLWPELDKLYGHGYELLALASSPDGRFVASTCKATSAEHAVVRIHDAKKAWKEVVSLPGHALTITKVKFSPNGRTLLTASRDRTWRLYQASEGQDGSTVFACIGAEKAHARIVWDCAWSDDGAMFATASRDKTVKLWRFTGAEGSEGNAYEPRATLRLPEAATAVDFAPLAGQHREAYMLAVGLETGDIHILGAADGTGAAWHGLAIIPAAHAEAVTQLAFRPKHASRPSPDGSSATAAVNASESGRPQLLSSSDDGLVRLFEINGN